MVDEFPLDENEDTVLDFRHGASSIKVKEFFRLTNIESDNHIKIHSLSHYEKFVKNSIVSTSNKD